MRRVQPCRIYIGEILDERLMALALDNRLGLGLLLVAGSVAFVIPATGHIHVVLGVALLAWFGFYLYKLSRGAMEEPELIGTAAVIGELPDRSRRATVVALFVVAAAVILVCAKPFANSLVDIGTELGVDRFLLVQWLAPLASEAPEFIIAVIFARRGNGTVAIAALISSKINQRTLLVGSLPIAYLVGGGSSSLALNGCQIEEVLLTAAQTIMGVALIHSLRFGKYSAWALITLFVIQFAVTSTQGRFVLCSAYVAIAVVAVLVNRRHFLPTLRSPFVE
ncbi:Ca2+/Na+ antiporter [Rhodococcus sp. 27YEA15]